LTEAALLRRQLMIVPALVRTIGLWSEALSRTFLRSYHSEKRLPASGLATSFARTAAEFGGEIRSDVVRWAKIVKDADIKLPQ
jgi:tripartite-type tricarboxylate transporter receptor subunit TctC